MEPVGVGSCSCRAWPVAVQRIVISPIAQAVCSDFELVGSHPFPTQSMEPAVVPLFGESVLKYMRGLDWKSRHEFYWWVALSPSKNSQFMAEYLREMLGPDELLNGRNYNAIISDCAILKLADRPKGQVPGSTNDNLWASRTSRCSVDVRFERSKCCSIAGLLVMPCQ